MKLMDQALGKAASGRTRTGEAIRDHGEKEAARLIRAGSKELGLPGGAAALAKLTKSDEPKFRYEFNHRDHKDHKTKHLIDFLAWL